MTYSRGKGVVTQVTASMLQGFKVDWTQFIENDPEVYQWIPDRGHYTGNNGRRFVTTVLAEAAASVD